MTSHEFLERRRRRGEPAMREVAYQRRPANYWEGHVPALLALACGLAAGWIVVVVVLSVRVLGWV